MNIRQIMKLEYFVAMINSKYVLFQNCDDVKLFTDSKIVKPEKVVMMGKAGKKEN